MSNETAPGPSNTKPTYSIIGILSAILAIIPISICAVIFGVVIVPDASEGVFAMYIILTLGVLLICLPLSLILGIIALRQRNRKKTFAAIGVATSGFIILLPVAIYVVFSLITKYSSASNISSAPEPPSVLPTTISTVTPTPIEAECTGSVTVEAYNNAYAGSSSSCPSGGYLYQSFLASSTKISSISIVLRAGGSFPPNGFTTHLALRDCQAEGSLLASADSMIPAPAQVGANINVTFDFPQPVSVSPGRRLIIEWTSPEPYQGIQFLSWMFSDGDAYPDGYSLTECVSGHISEPDFDEDYVFQVNEH